MAINYNTDIVTALFTSDVEAVAAYQAPGSFGLPTAYGSFTLDNSSAVAAGGSGYHVGDSITLSGGTNTTASQVSVLTLGASGAVATFDVIIPGVYTVLPTNPVATTGGNGTGFTITAVWQGAASQRLLSFIELFRSYIAQMTTEHEQRLVQTIIRRMLAELKYGAGYSASTNATNAQAAALHFIAANTAKLTGIL